jgi:hypothetical protein
MSAKTNSKWKDALLKTSLPLEYLVAEKLGKKKFDVFGEFSFSRKNEQGLDTEFSVDLHAVDNLENTKGNTWAFLHLLIECKYNYPGVKWIFAPQPPNAVTFTGVISRLQDLCTNRVSNFDSLEALDDSLPFCVKGIELHETDANVQSISRGLHQLRWAVPQLAADCLIDQANMWHDEDLHVEFICPILVTTASLHILRRDSDLNSFQQASNIDDVTEKVKALVVYQERGPQLNQYLRDIFGNLQKRVPQIETRLKSLWELTHTQRKQNSFPHDWGFNFSIDYLAKRVLVVNFDAFEDVLTTITTVTQKCGKKLKRAAVLSYDPKTKNGIILPYRK